MHLPTFPPEGKRRAPHGELDNFEFPDPMFIKRCSCLKRAISALSYSQGLGYFGCPTPTVSLLWGKIRVGAYQSECLRVALGTYYKGMSNHFMKFVTKK